MAHLTHRNSKRHDSRCPFAGTRRLLLSGGAGIILLIANLAGAQNLAWLKGSNTPNQTGIYGTQFTPAPAAITPGGREQPVSWRDTGGNLWAFGGLGYGASVSPGLLNDLWKYEVATGNWTWMKGSNAVNQVGTYGTTGTAAAANTPGARFGSVSWIDASGNLWLFGGRGYGAAASQGNLNDLWKFDVSSSNWTCLSGSSAVDQVGIYGTLGTPAPANTPGGRYGSVSWSDASGNLWLFGGTGNGASASNGNLNDLWKFDVLSGNWTWMSGSNTVDQVGIYGTMGMPAPANMPGGRESAVSWSDAFGNLWLFGGGGYGDSSSGLLNDLWIYNIATGYWTWAGGSSNVNQTGVYGTQGTADAANIPGGRTGSVPWNDSMGNFWLFGGFGTSSVNNFNDMWKYEPSSGNWTWIKGSAGISQGATYGTQGTASPANTPGWRRSSVSWTGASGKLWLFGGVGIPSELNELWEFDVADGNWTWVRGGGGGFAPGVYGRQGSTAAVNTPGARKSSVSWRDTSGTLWVFGGSGNGQLAGHGLLNDLWRFDSAARNWVWMKGNNSPDQPGTYGTQGVADPANTPGGREGSVSWMDAAGNLWLFGGRGYDASASIGSLSDLWKYDVSLSEWIWIAGSSTSNQLGVYGTEGTAAPGNSPGGRESAAAWIDPSSGIAWIFGGIGYGASTQGQLNDLWSYDPGTGYWTWMKGSNAPSQLGTYGAQGTPNAANTPGAREGSVSWIDASGKLWLFAGQGYGDSASTGSLNDLWKYDVSLGEWIWIAGSSTPNQSGVYGTVGIAASGNSPGARDHCVSWPDPSPGITWIFGGRGYGDSASTGSLNDLWKYDTTTGYWTWMKGSSAPDQLGTYGTLETTGIANVPGARDSCASWSDVSGNLWIFGGNGFDASTSGYLDDTWQYDVTTGQWIWMSGSNVTNQTGTYGVQGVSSPPADVTPGGRQYAAAMSDTSGNFFLFGGQGYGAAASIGFLNDLWKFDPLSCHWTWMNGSASTNQLGGYDSPSPSGFPGDDPPGGRLFSTSWSDASGNLWMFGGLGYGDSASLGLLNDMWKYEPATNKWSWWAGAKAVDQPGFYGTQGIGSMGSTPGGRFGSVSWTDTSGTLWLFGGGGSGSSDNHNDLWKFDTGTNFWTWMKGSNSGSQPAVYGTQGSADPANTPGWRSLSASCADTSGNLWLFGGSGSGAPPGELNDLWKYDIATGNWTWMKGSSAGDQPGTYGTMGAPDPANTPGGRDSCVLWADASDNLWLFGGSGRDSAASLGALNDLWKFDRVTGNWAWMKGNDTIGQTGSYGTQGIAAGGNIPGGRIGSTGRRGPANTLYLFGGNGYGAASSGNLNDFWIAYLNLSIAGAPTISSAMFHSASTLDVSFNEAMSFAPLLASDYTISGPDTGTLAAQPDSVTWLGGNTYRLAWNSGSHTGNNLIVTVPGTMTDATGEAIANNTTTVPVKFSAFIAE